jgi:vancomycin permeability regulator SanA
MNPQTVNDPVTAAVVLGAAVLAGGRPSPALERRARHAAGLYLDGTVGAVILCGGIGRHPPSEAAVARRLCRDLGVPDHALHLDTASASTAENLRNARLILAGIGATSAIVVTDRFHAPRALLTARRLGIVATASCPAPAGSSRVRMARNRLREVPAYLWYLLRLPNGPR